MDSAQIARDGLARIEKRYWFGAETKRRIAAVETLDQLYQEAGGSSPDLGKLIRAAAQRVPESGLTRAYRDGLARVGQMTAAEAAEPVSLLAAVALATAPDSSVPGLDEVVRQTNDPVATAVRGERLGRDGLRLLADLPRERGCARTIAGLWPSTRWPVLATTGRSRWNARLDWSRWPSTSFPRAAWRP